VTFFLFFKIFQVQAISAVNGCVEIPYKAQEMEKNEPQINTDERRFNATLFENLEQTCRYHI